jgi:hypothetical protein
MVSWSCIKSEIIFHLKRTIGPSIRTLMRQSLRENNIFYNKKLEIYKNSANVCPKLNSGKNIKAFSPSQCGGNKKKAIF